jgi:hypothetical protein
MSRDTQFYIFCELSQFIQLQLAIRGFFYGFYLHACSKFRYEYSLVIYTSSFVSLCFTKGRIRSVRWRRRHPMLQTHVLNHVSTMLKNFTYPFLLAPHHSHASYTPTIPNFPIITTSSPLKSVVPPKTSTKSCYECPIQHTPKPLPNSPLVTRLSLYLRPNPTHQTQSRTPGVGTVSCY